MSIFLIASVVLAILKLAHLTAVSWIVVAAPAIVGLVLDVIGVFLVLRFGKQIASAIVRFAERWL